MTIRAQPDQLCVARAKLPSPGARAMQATLLRLRGVFIDAEVRQSTIPGAGYGLFTNKFIPKGTPIAVYRGRWKAIDPLAPYKPYTGKNRNVVEIDDYRILPPLQNDSEFTVCHHFPAAAVNEPKPGNVANAAFVRWFGIQQTLPHHQWYRILEGARRMKPCDEYVKALKPELVVIHAAADIAAGQEIFAHYGSAYAARRDYEVGSAATFSKLHDVSKPQWPGIMAERLGIVMPLDALPPLLARMEDERARW